VTDTAVRPELVEGLVQHIAAYRASGAWKADPVRFRFLESLAERLQGQPDAVQRVLCERVQQELDAFTAIAVANVPANRTLRSVQAEPAEASSLAALTARLNARASTAGELPSVRRFREAWESGRTLDRLEQALARSPANAGPLNSHALVVRSLALMGDASVDYLRRFLVYAESLQWLESAKQQMPAKGGKAPARKKKGRGG
jgi:hypothetical protein